MIPLHSYGDVECVINGENKTNWLNEIREDYNHLEGRIGILIWYGTRVRIRRLLMQL